VPVLKDIVTLRAIIGSPLKSFTFYFQSTLGSHTFDIHAHSEQKWELIGADKSFIMEEVVPAQGFRLDI
jgi:hypothetical protein